MNVSVGAPTAAASVPPAVRGELAAPTGSLRTICSWCERVMVDGPPAPVSHGICAPCFDTVLAG